MRRCLLVLTLAAGCGFDVTPGAAIDPPRDTAPPDVDAAAPVPDAAPDARTCSRDVDQDGVCDDNDGDTWLCGLTPPAAPGATVSLDETQNTNERKISVSAVKLAGGTNLRNVARGATFTLAADYAISDCICTGCIDQIQVGFPTQPTKKCLYDANPTCPAASMGSNTLTFTAPMQPGVYAIGFRLGQDYSCEGNSNTRTGWWGMPPTPPEAAQTIAKICVPAVVP